MKWTDHEREDFSMIPLMNHNGYTVYVWFFEEELKETPYSPDHPPDITTFRKNLVHVWHFRDGWQIADMIDGSYTNHRPVETLEQVIISVKQEEILENFRKNSPITPGDPGVYIHFRPKDSEE